MKGQVYVEEIGSDAIDARSDGMTLRFVSDGDTFAFRLSHHAAVKFSEKMKRESWPLHCAPDGELVDLGERRAEGGS